MQKFALVPTGKSMALLRASLALQEGRTRRHGRWAGDAMDARRAPDECADLADGEVVWS
jgi:hypothetical protein